MKREFLKNLGLEDAVIDQILDENSRDITKVDAKDYGGGMAYWEIGGA